MQKKLFFKNSNGVKLCGILANPADLAIVPIVILCHGFTTSKESATYVLLRKHLMK